MGSPLTGWGCVYASRLDPIPNALLGPLISASPAAAASPGTPGPRGPLQEPRPRPPIFDTSAFAAVIRKDPPTRHRPPQEPSPKPPISATPAIADASPGSLALPVAQSSTTVEINNWEDLHLLALHWSAKIVAIISPQFPLHALPLLVATIVMELKKPQELQNFVVANPEIIDELRTQWEFVLKTAREIDSKRAQCNQLVDEMVDIQKEISSIGIAVHGIKNQIGLVADVGVLLSQARQKLVHEYWI